MEQSQYSIGWLEESVGGTEPLAFRHHVPVDAGEDLLLHPEPLFGRYSLVGIECRRSLAAILEFAEHKLVISCENRAA